LFSVEISLAEEQGLENRKLRMLFSKGRIRKMSRKEFLKNRKGCKGLKVSQMLFKKFFFFNASQGLAFIALHV